VRLIPLAGFDDNLRPLSPNQLARREQIRETMRRAAAAAREGRDCLWEICIACAVAAPVAVGIVIHRLSNP
jgi:hypothetical protein